MDRPDGLSLERESRMTPPMKIFLWIIFAAVSLGLFALIPHGRAEPVACPALTVVLGEKPAGTPLNDFLLAGIAARPELRAQRAIGSIPSHSLYTLSGRLGNWVLAIDDWFDLKARPDRLRDFFCREKVLPYGGFIYFDYDLTRIHDFKDYRAFVAENDRLFTSQVAVRYRDAGQARQAVIRIRPMQTADCALSYQTISYCRGPFIRYVEDFKASHADNHANDVALVKGIIGLYRWIGLHSTLSPDIDIQSPAESASNLEFTRQVTRSIFDAGLIPSPKHFMYLRKFGNLHDEPARENLSAPFFDEALKPYDAVEAFGRPYFLMISHHSLPLDPGTPLTISSKARRYLTQRYPRATLLCDEIRMESLAPMRLEGRIRNLSCDAFLIHSGNFIFLGGRILKGLGSVDADVSHPRVLSMLKLKQAYGLLSISPR
jgi:hypothetical protein